MKKYNFDHLSKKEKEVMWAKIKPILDKFDAALSKIEAEVQSLKEISNG